MKRSRTKPASRPLSIEWAGLTQFPVPIPKDEPQRLKDLHSFDILDSLPEAAFDVITLLASQICGTPIAVMSLVDSERQWFKSKVGLSFSESSRDIAFCAHAIMQHELFIVPDASKDRRFTHNPLVSAEPKIRFYAGAPLVSEDDHAIGTLCVMDLEPRELTTGQKEALRVLSRVVMNQLQMRRSIRELTRALDRRRRTTRPRKKTTQGAQAALLGKAAHEMQTTARVIVQVMQRALTKPCTPEQHELLRAARSSADSLLPLARKMRKAAEGA